MSEMAPPKLKKRYQVKEWQKIDYVTQRVLMKKYEIVIVKDRTPKKLFYTIKQWKKIPVDMQMWILKTHDVILTDWKSRKEKIQGYLGFLDPKNINKGIDKFQKGMNKMDKNWKQWDKMMKGTNGMFGKQKDISSVTGKKEAEKKRKHKKRKKPRQEPERDFIALLGKKTKIWGKQKLGLW